MVISSGYIIHQKNICHSGVSQNLVAMNYIKAIITKWIPDIEFLNNKLLRNPSSGMTYNKKGEVPYLS